MTPNLNTIPKHEEVPYPGNRDLERRVESLIRWNAMAMVHRQNKKDAGIGGHISTYSSLATLLEVGFNHFFHVVWRSAEATLSTSRATHRRVSTRAPTSKAASTHEQAPISVMNLRDKPGSPPTHTLWPTRRNFALPEGIDRDAISAASLSRIAASLRRRTARSGFVGDGETDEVDTLAVDGHARESEQPDLRHQLQRPGWPGAATSGSLTSSKHVPRRGGNSLLRSCGVGTGQALRTRSHRLSPSKRMEECRQ